MTICEQIADAYLTMTEESFEDWFAKKAMNEPDSDWELLRSVYLAGDLTEEWFNDHASSQAN